MNQNAFCAEHLSDAQVVDLLTLALRSSEPNRELSDTYDRLCQMAAGDLLKTAQGLLTSHGLEETAAARLLGVTDLTAKRWFSSTDSLPEQVKPKLAGLCALLPLVDGGQGNPRVANLVNIAIRIVKARREEVDTVGRDERLESLLRVYEAVGLMAVAFFLAIGPTADASAGESMR